ncbi:MAG: uroporphyrinogen-III C-methyltransferase [Burkholderiales bacterium]|jgi:uroporphyrin-III C-methyltransferase|nr:uroporphyrinogen-III C-methyltransferase [Burkholderiales bacterium]
MTGRVYLVGAGPGAADLLTLRAARLLAQADVVLHDALVDPAVLALAPQARCVAVGKRACRPSTAQRFICKQLVDAARRHACVVRLKGGDPMLFGRAAEEIDALDAAGIAFEVVPGITAACAAAAQLRVPLTVRGVARSVAFVTPRVGAGETASDWDAVAGADSLALYMAGHELDRVLARLVASGRPASTPVVAIANASLPDTRVWSSTLGQGAALPDAFAGAAVLVFVGDAFARVRAAEARALAAAVPPARAAA